jgi:hypothetical protein
MFFFFLTLSLNCFSLETLSSAWSYHVFQLPLFKSLTEGTLLVSFWLIGGGLSSLAIPTVGSSDTYIHNSRWSLSELVSSL